MYFIIYKVTNLINGKFYTGKHRTLNINDDYMGSGHLIKKAIQKYGIENFVKEIIRICGSEKEMNLAEKILVVVDQEISYNLCAGGHGGFGFINNSAQLVAKRDKKENKIKGYLSNKDKMISSNKNWNIETAKSNGINAKINKTGIFHPDYKPKLLSEETKRKISESLKKRNIKISQEL
jgi:hypothetical protein